MPKKEKFPKSIIVTIENAGTADEYLNAREIDDLDGIDESTVAAVYDLAGQGVVSVTRDFQFKGGKK